MKNLPDKKPKPKRRISVIRAFWRRTLDMVKPGKRESLVPQVVELMARDVTEARMLREKQKRKRIAITNDAKRTSEFNRYTRYLERERKQLKRCETAIGRLMGSKVRRRRFDRLGRHAKHHASEIDRVRTILFAELVTPDSRTI